jgi:hypothetical protein
MVTPQAEIEPDMLERIVREVTRRLRAMPRPMTMPDDNSSSMQAREMATTVSPTVNVVSFAVPVVTLAEVTGRLEGVREVAIGPRTILTPAVQDLLVQQRIAVTRNATQTVPATGPPPLLVASMTTIGHAPESYWQQLERLGMVCQQVAGSSLTGILEELATLLAGGAHQGMLLTDQTAVALCLANRQPEIRAILATGVDALRRDTQDVGANLLVVSPHGRTAYQVGSLAREFCRVGVLPCPEKYRTWLS